MKCKDCKRFTELANTTETGHGVCTYPDSFTPVIAEHECLYSRKPYQCKDCNHYIEHDTACMTALPDDSAYQGDRLCVGFVDQREMDVLDALYDWKLRGYDIQEKLKKVTDFFEREFEVPFQQK